MLTVFFRFDDEAYLYIGRWGRQFQGAGCGETGMTATAPGSRFTFGFSGAQALLHFETDHNQTPYPHLFVSVDGGARVEVPLDRYIRVDGRTAGEHTVEVILKGMVESSPRWCWPLANKVSFLGAEAEAVHPVKLPRRRKKTLEVVGDSITEGVLVDAQYQTNYFEVNNRVYQDDVTATYGWLLAEKLGMEPLIMGYGAVGVTKGGCGGVPAAAQAYPYCFAGTPVEYDRRIVAGGHPDMVLINHGTNDGRADEVTFTAGYVALLDAILMAHPKTQVVAMSPFAGAWEKEIERIVAAYNERHGQHILFINGSHWLPKEPLHPGRDGHALAAEKLAGVLKEALG